MLKKQAKTLSRNQVQMVVSYLQTKRHSRRNVVMFLLSVKAGLRAKEITLVQWSNLVDSEGKLMDELHLPNLATKGNSGRVVPLSKDLKASLAELFEAHKGSRGFSLDQTVLQSQKGGSFARQAVINWFKDLYNDLGVVGGSSHSGRRTAITNWARNVSRAGGSLRDVQALAGHSALSVTQGYIDFERDAQKALVNLW